MIEYDDAHAGEACSPASKKGSSSLKTIVTSAIVIAIVTALGILALRASGLMPDNGREASGWMYREVGLVAKACPQLAPDVRAIAAQPKMSVADVKRIAEMLRTAAAESERASGRYEGRLAMGMPVNGRPATCSKYDPNYDMFAVELLAPYNLNLRSQEDGS